MRAGSLGAVTVVVLVLLAGQASSQEGTWPPKSDTVSAKDWVYSPSAYGFVVPGDEDCVQLTVGASYGALYIEARYNYEALKTGSLWFGYSIEAGDELWLELTPMVGGVFGDLGAVAPGYNISLGYRKLDFYSEGELVLDLEDREEDWFYAWTELAISPSQPFRFGLVLQRTRAYESDLEIERGLLAGYAYRRWEITAYVFNLGWEEPTFVLSVATEF